MFIKAYASSRRGPMTQGEFYRRTGTTNLGGNARTRGMNRPIQQVRGGTTGTAARRG